MYTLIQLLMIEDQLYLSMDECHEDDPEGYMYMNFINDIQVHIIGWADTLGMMG